VLSEGGGKLRSPQVDKQALMQKCVKYERQDKLMTIRIKWEIYLRNEYLIFKESGRILRVYQVKVQGMFRREVQQPREISILPEMGEDI